MFEVLKVNNWLFMQPLIEVKKSIFAENRKLNYYFCRMRTTITIKLRNKKAKNILKNLEDLNLIEILENDEEIEWTLKKKRQAKDFLSALKEAKLAESGKIKLKTAHSLIDEL